MYKAIGGDANAQNTSQMDMYIFLLLRDVGTCIRNTTSYRTGGDAIIQLLLDCLETPVPSFGKLSVNVPEKQQKAKGYRLRTSS